MTTSSASVGTKRIEDVIEKLIDYRGKTPTKTNSGVVLITAKVIKDGRIWDGDHEYIAEDDYDTWMRRGLPKQGDVLITTEAPLGEVAQLRTRDKVALAQRVILLRANPQVMDEKYLFYALRSPFVQNGLRTRATGTTVLGIKQSELREVLLPCPALAAQRSTAAVLSALDDLIENNIRRINLLEDMARLIYREWFIHYRFPNHEEMKMMNSGTELGQVPEGWEVKSASTAIEINPRTKMTNEGFFVGMDGLSSSSMLISNIQRKETSSGAKYKNGDTLFARITPCLENGKTGFVQFLPTDETVGCGSTEFIVLRSKTLTPEYVYLLARQDDFRKNAQQSMTGASGRQRVQPECFEKYLLVNPDAQTLSRFTELVRPMFQLCHILGKRNEFLKRSRDLLLPKLISGQLAIN